LLSGQRPDDARARVAQLVEQRIENPRVGGSNPPPGTIFLRIIDELWTACFGSGRREGFILRRPGASDEPQGIAG